MLRTDKTLTLGLVALLVVGGSLTAHAQTITLGPQSITATTDFSGSFFFTKFNPALGTLNSVVITLGNSMTSTLTVNNNSGSASTGLARTELQAGIADSGTTFSTPGNVLTASGGLFNMIDDFQTNSAGYSLAGTGSTILNPPTRNSSVSSAPNFSSAAVLAYFSGASGSAQINYITFTTTNVSNIGGTTTATQSTIDTLSATVTYNYTPVGSAAAPEPGTWAMLIVGASTGLVALRRRNKK